MTEDKLDPLAYVEAKLAEAERDTGKRELVFDADASQYCGGDRCALCNSKQFIDKPPRGFVRIRRKVTGGTEPIAHLCANCIARALLVVERSGYWRDVNPTVLAAIERLIVRNRGRASKTPRLPPAK